jgi:MFS family permease
VIAQNRWVRLSAALVAMVMIANLQYAWTLFVEPIQVERGRRLSEIQFAFTLFVLLQVWTQPLDGWLIDRLGPRGFIGAAGLLCGLGWAGMPRRTMPCCILRKVWPRSSAAGLAPCCSSNLDAGPWRSTEAR